MASVYFSYFPEHLHKCIIFQTEIIPIHSTSFTLIVANCRMHKVFKPLSSSYWSPAKRDTHPQMISSSRMDFEWTTMKYKTANFIASNFKNHHKFNRQQMTKSDEFIFYQAKRKIKVICIWLLNTFGKNQNFFMADQGLTTFYANWVAFLNGSLFIASVYFIQTT